MFDHFGGAHGMHVYAQLARVSLTVKVKTNRYVRLVIKQCLIV